MRALLIALLWALACTAVRAAPAPVLMAAPAQTPPVPPAAGEGEQEAPGEPEEQSAPSEQAVEAEQVELVSGADADLDALLEADEPSGLTGDWGGLRTEWEERGFTVEATWTVDVAGVLRGGVRHRETTLNLMDLGLGLDLEPMLGWEGATAYAELWHKTGRVLYADVGDFQGTSNIDTPAQTQIAELWLQQWLVPDRLRVKVGKLDTFDEFAVVNGAAEFLNNGMAYAPTLFVAPTYPDPAYSAGLYATPVEHLWLSGAVFDGAGQAGVETGGHGAGTFLGPPSDLFLIAEAGTDWVETGSLLAGRVGLGAWSHNGHFERFDGTRQDDTSGSYVVMDQALWREHPGEGDDPQGLDAFLQFGHADQRVSDVRRNAAAGVAWTGPLPERDEDVLGLGFTLVKFTGEPGAGYTRDDELALECFYRYQSTPWLAIKPDLQWVTHPGGDASLNDALVATVRFEVAL